MCRLKLSKIPGQAGEERLYSEEGAVARRLGAGRVGKVWALCGVGRGG